MGTSEEAALTRTSEIERIPVGSRGVQTSYLSGCLGVNAVVA